MELLVEPDSSHWQAVPAVDVMSAPSVPAAVAGEVGLNRTIGISSHGSTTKEGSGSEGR